MKSQALCRVFFKRLLASKVNSVTFHEFMVAFQIMITFPEVKREVKEALMPPARAFTALDLMCIQTACDTSNTSNLYVETSKAYSFSLVSGFC